MKLSCVCLLLDPIYLSGVHFTKLSESLNLFICYFVLGTDDRCEPQPIPSLVVGREKDWVSLAPYALHLWEKLLIEPFSYSRDVAYVVVAPDNEFILQKVRIFFKELSSMYEVCLRALNTFCNIFYFLNFY
jgi:hypothetical protein